MITDHLFLRAGEICLCQWVHQQPRDARKDELEVLVPVDPRQIVEEQVVRRHALLPLPAVVVQRDQEDLKRQLHQLLLTVGPEEMVVREDAGWLVATDRVEEAGEERESVSVVRGGEDSQPGRLSPPALLVD